MAAKTTSHLIINTNIHPSSQVLSHLFTNTFFFHPYAVYQTKWLLKPHHISLLTQTSTLHHNYYLTYLLTHFLPSICRLLNEMTAKTTSHLINTNIHPSPQLLSHLFANTFFFHPYAVYQKKWPLKPHHIWLLPQTSTLHHNCYLTYLLTHFFSSIYRLPNEMTAKTTSHLITNTNIHPSSQLLSHLFTNTFFFIHIPSTKRNDC